MISSPCINICVMEKGLCIGCGRTLDEIAAWGSLAENERRALIAVLPWRLAALDPNRAGLKQETRRSRK